MRANDPKTGLTLGELYAFAQRQLNDHNRDPREPVRITVGWRQQITTIWMPENRED